MSAIPPAVMWTYIAGGVALAAGILTIFLRGEWRRAQGWERLILFGPVFYGAPIAAFGTEHFTIHREIAALVPAWIPAHSAVAYCVGGCFIAAGFSLATRIQAQLAAALLALVFFLFVVLMDAPGFAAAPHSRFAAALLLRELSFCGGALALAAALGGAAQPLFAGRSFWPLRLGCNGRDGRQRTPAAPPAVSRSPRGERRGNIAAVAARYFIGVTVVYYCIEQFRHGRHVPGIPLEAVTPAWIFGHAVWTYVAAAVFAAGGALLLANIRARAAATAVGAVVLLVVLTVYVPMAVAEHTNLTGINYAADTLMYCGAVLMLAAAMPTVARLRPTPAPAVSIGG